LILKQGARLKEHRVRGGVAMTIVAGSIRLNYLTLKVGTVAAIDLEASHAVEAIEESALIPTAVLR
jgi:hypothetical protein